MDIIMRPREVHVSSAYTSPTYCRLMRLGFLLDTTLHPRMRTTQEFQNQGFDVWTPTCT